MEHEEKYMKKTKRIKLRSEDYREDLGTGVRGKYLKSIGQVRILFCSSRK